MSTTIFGRDTVEIEDDELPELGVTFGTLAEDQVIMRFAKLLPADRRFYVDAGAYDPVKNSNTLLLFKRGWRGINIDANADAIGRFMVKRPNDVNIHAFLASDRRELIYAEYASVTTNRLITPDGSGKSYKGESALRKTVVHTQTLDSILERHLSATDKIGYLNVDCEGLDLDVVIGGNINRWRPSIVSIEGNTPEEQAQALDYFTQCNYELRATIIVTQVYTDKACPIMSNALRYRVTD